ncbi:hypothetical protein DFH94DRAFT_758363 [Russula ochroleuca]|uniref:Uncharacterized protein n=1 Tax=Russula ochroleuca TaxID=152965 RepID=A0A9P5MRT1_9AGAM|nr:hypothetical protein DFH94DRAFT_758363 [Russula ochroleuca]
MLIERGADVTAQNKDGVSPLHLASQVGHVGVARMLLEYGGDETEVWETPLYPLAATQSHSTQMSPE